MPADDASRRDPPSVAPPPSPSPPPSRPAGASLPPGRPGLHPDTTTVRLGRLRRGRLRGVRLRLMEVRGAEKRPTDFFLDVKVCCHEPEREFCFDVKADFGDVPPRAARLVLLRSRYEASPPLLLVRERRAAEIGVPLTIDPGTIKVIFWVTTEGSARVPARLAAEIRGQPPTGEEPAVELDTLRLPSIKAVIAAALTDALREAPSR